MDDFEITKREILASVSIVAVMLLIGILISEKISEYQLDENEMYNKAAKIESRELFQYGMDTNVGNAFVYGDLRAVDAVTYPEIDGEYCYLKKIEEHYRKHTEQVEHTRTVNGETQTYYTMETYWTWDTIGSAELKCRQISFCGVKFDISKILLPPEKYIDTIYESKHVKYVYYGIAADLSGTIFTKLEDGTIQNGTHFYDNWSIDDTEKHLTGDAGVVVFWTLWVILIIVSVISFYRLDNDWLER